MMCYYPRKPLDVIITHIKAGRLTRFIEKDERNAVTIDELSDDEGV